ncbi:MAG: acyl carrier protein [Pseudomonadota bacterium]
MQGNVRKSVTEQVQRILREGCERRGMIVDPQPDTALAALGLDSLQLVEMVFELESYYAVQVDEELLAQLQSVADVIDMLTQALPTAAVEELA